MVSEEQVGESLKGCRNLGGKDARDQPPFPLSGGEGAVNVGGAREREFCDVIYRGNFCSNWTSKYALNIAIGEVKRLAQE